MYTGGTTGLPKGALLDQRAEMLNLYHIAMTVDLAPGRVYLHHIPMFHAASMGGILGIPAIGGVSVFQPLFEPEAVMALTELYKVDWTTVVPTMIAMILNHPNFRPERFASMRDPRLRRLAYAARPARPPARRAAARGLVAGIRHDGVLVRADDAHEYRSPRRGASTALGRQARPRGPALGARPRRQRVATARGRRGLRPRRATSSASTGTGRRRPRRLCTAAGTTPATSGISTRRVSYTLSTGRTT